MEDILGIIFLIIVGIWALPLMFMALLPAALAVGLVFVTTQLLYRLWLNQAVAQGWLEMTLNPDLEAGNLKVQVTANRFVGFFSFLVIAGAAVVALAATGVVVNVISKSPEIGEFKAFLIFAFAQVGWIWFSVRFYRFGDHREMLRRAAAAALDAPGLASKFMTLKGLDDQAVALLRQTGTASAGWPFGIESWLRTVPFMGLRDTARVHQEIDQQIVSQQEAVAELSKCVDRVNEANEKVVAGTRQALKAPNGLFWETAISDEKEKLQYEELYSLVITKRWAEFHEIMDEIIGGLDRVIAEMAGGKHPHGPAHDASSSIRDKAAALDFFGVPDNTPLAKIASLRKELVRKYHEDLNSSMSEEARRHLTRIMSDLNEAWEVLSRNG